MIKYFFKKDTLSIGIIFFIMLLAVSAHAQRERLQTPDPINDFRLIERKLIDAREMDSLARIYPWLDSLFFYDITFSSFGHTLTGFYILPKKGNRFPGIVYNIGGNVHGMHFDHAWSTRVMAKYATSGYAMIAYNYLDQKNEDIIEEFGGRDVDVVADLIDHLHLFPEIDTSRLGSLGWSRGGLEIYKLLTKTNKLKAVAVGGAVADIEEMAADRPVMDSVFANYVGDKYWSNKQSFYAARNAKTWVKQFPKNVPILMLHGNSDWRVKNKQSLDMAALFDQERIPYRLIVFEGGDHGVSEHKQERDEQIIRWFDRFLKNNEPLPNMKYHGN